jgi:uncharacterized protein YbaR (Trm112 family)/SAM-dependent methyltransferase
MNDLSPISEVLACPLCRGRLNASRDALACAGCTRVYPLTEGVPQLAVFSETDPSQAGAAPASPAAYEQRYQDFERARTYNLKYDRQILKRLSTLREYQILRRLLGRRPRCRSLLEIPCGGGRVSPRLAGATELLIQADIGMGQVQYAMSRERLGVAQIWMTASAFRLPFQDAGVDAAVCIRLSHHLPTAAQREQLLVELLRVARRFVVMTFFDQNSLKNTLRRARGKRPKFTMTVSRVRELAAANGAALAACPRLSYYGSGHRYALMVKGPTGSGG